MASNLTPTPKVAAGVALGTPLALVLHWIASEVGLDMPESVAVAFGSLIVGAVAYFKKDNS